MTDNAKKQPGPSTIVKNTRLWPKSFVKPEKQTNVCIRSYIFSDSTKVQKFLDFLKEKFPDRDVNLKQLDNGKVSVSLTSSSQSASNDDGCTMKRVQVMEGYRTNRVYYNEGVNKSFSCYWFSNWYNKRSTIGTTPFGKKVYRTLPYLYSSHFKGARGITIPWHTGDGITCDNAWRICNYGCLQCEIDQYI